MWFELAKNENLLGLVIFTSLACFSHCFHVNSIACNASSTKSCPAFLYYVPKEPKTIEETTSLFHVNSNSINSTLSGFAIVVSCGCPDNHDEFTYHVEYTVQPGDTWKVISSKFGFLVVEKPDKALIPSLNITLDILCGCSANMEILTYKIESGDTLFTICARFDANVEKTEKLNKLENRDLIFAGEVLYIPEPGRSFVVYCIHDCFSGYDSLNHFHPLVTVLRCIKNLHFRHESQCVRHPLGRCVGSMNV